MAQDEKVSFAPGMTMPVVAGQEYTLKDNTGESLILEGRDDPLTIEFAQSFSTYVAVRAVYPSDAESCKAAWQACLDAFDALPKRVIDQFSTARGIIVPSGRSL